jgi:hypothetical protein
LKSSYALLYACGPGAKTSEKSNLLEKLRKFLIKHTKKNGEIHGLPGILTKLQGKNGVEATISNPQDFILKWAKMPSSTRRDDPKPAPEVADQVEEESKEPLTTPSKPISDA